MSIHTDKLSVAYKAAIERIEKRIQEEEDFLGKETDDLKKQVVREAAPPPAAGLQALNPALAASGELDVQFSKIQQAFDKLTNLARSLKDNADA